MFAGGCFYFYGALGGRSSPAFRHTAAGEEKSVGRRDPTNQKAPHPLASFFFWGGGSFFLFYDSESFYEITVFLFQSIDHHQYYVSKHVCVVFGKSTQKWNDELDSINEIEYKVSFVRMILFSIRMECAHCKFYLVLLGFT